MLKIIMLQGLPASGKSTWAKQFVSENPTYKRINKDDLREMLDAGKYSKTNERFILKTRNWLIRQVLLQHQSVIIDDTNFHPSHEKKLREIAQELESEMQKKIHVEVRIFDTPLEECIRRDQNRLNPVGESVIRMMAQQQKSAQKRSRKKGA